MIPTRRRPRLLAAAAAVLCGVLLVTVPALLSLGQEGGDDPAPGERAERTPRPRQSSADVPEESIAAIARGHAWLVEHQGPTGAWHAIVGHKLNYDYMPGDPRPQEHVGITALAAMSLMAGGNHPGRGRYGDNVEAAMDYLLSVTDSGGWISDNGSRMYSHAFATLVLAEAYGMSRRADMGRKLERSVMMLVSNQNEQGGWRYSPLSREADLSITVSVVQALRAARNAGVYVPSGTIEKAIAYVKKASESMGHEFGGFNYQVDRPSRVTWPLTACGVTALMSAGDYDSREVKNGLDYLVRGTDRFNNETVFPRGRADDFRFDFFYGHYYAMQGLYQNSLHRGGDREWDRYWSRTRRIILDRQRADGSWSDAVGEIYATSMATLLLQLPNEYLPIFEK